MLLGQWPTMPAMVIAHHIGWQYSSTTSKIGCGRFGRRLRVWIRAIESRTSRGRSRSAWFPDAKIPVAPGQARVLPVLVMVLDFSRLISAVMLPSRRMAICWLGCGSSSRVGAGYRKALVWDREAVIGGTGKPTTGAAGFAGTLATRIVLAPARDPEFKGIVERANQYLKTSFLPGRMFASPADFNTQVTEWLCRKEWVVSK